VELSKLGTLAVNGLSKVPLGPDIARMTSQLAFSHRVSVHP